MKTFNVRSRDQFIKLYRYAFLNGCFKWTFICKFFLFFSPANVSKNNFCCFSNSFSRTSVTRRESLFKTVRHISISTTITTFITVVYINWPYFEFEMFLCELLIFQIFLHFTCVAGFVSAIPVAGESRGNER